MAIYANAIREWKIQLAEEESNSGATINCKLSALRVMLTHAVDYGRLPGLPKVAREEESEHRIRWFSDVEERAMLSRASRADGGCLSPA